MEKRRRLEVLCPESSTRKTVQEFHLRHPDKQWCRSGLFVIKLPSGSGSLLFYQVFLNVKKTNLFFYWDLGLVAACHSFWFIFISIETYNVKHKSQSLRPTLDLTLLYQKVRKSKNLSMYLCLKKGRKNALIGSGSFLRIYGSRTQRNIHKFATGKIYLWSLFFSPTHKT